MTVRKKTTTNKRTRAGKLHSNAKKTIYNGIEFDSQLEVLMYKLLKIAGIEFKYIGKDKEESYLVQEEFQYEGECIERAQKRSKQMADRRKVDKAVYTPDFVGENEEWFIEVKGRRLGDFGLRWRMFKKVMNQRNPVPTLFMPTKKDDCEQVIEILKQKGYGRN